MTAGVHFSFDASWAKFARGASPILLLWMRAEAPVRTGDFRNKMLVRTNGRHIMVMSRAVPGRFIVEGTKPHDIVPIRAQALHFTAKSGAEVFTRRVHHPGTKPNKFHYRAWEHAEPAIHGLLHAAMGEAAKLHIAFYEQLIPAEI